MTEEIIKLAKTIVEYSIDVQPKERVMISFSLMIVKILLKN